MENKKLETWILKGHVRCKLLFLICFLLSATVFVSCAKPAKSDSNAVGAARILMMNAPDGSTCYAFVDGDGRYFGGNCR